MKNTTQITNEQPASDTPESAAAPIAPEHRSRAHRRLAAIGGGIVVLLGSAATQYDRLPESTRATIGKFFKTIIGGETPSPQQLTHQSISVVEAWLPEVKRKGFQQTATEKVSIKTPSPLPVTKLTTVFFKPRTESGPGGFIKLQMIDFASQAAGRTTIAALSYPPPKIPLPTRKLYVLRGDDTVESCAQSDDGKFHDISIGPGDRILIAVVYPGEGMVDGRFGAELRDWMIVEVSDHANKGPIQTQIAVGDASQSLRFPNLRAYSFMGDGDDVWFTPLRAPKSFYVSAEKDIKDMARHMPRLTQDFHQFPVAVKAFKDLGLQTASGGAESIGAAWFSTRWATDQQDRQSDDLAYMVTSP